MSYLKTMLLPTVMAGIVSLGTMLLIFRRQLIKPMQECEESGEITDMPVMVISLVHLLICVTALAISQYISIEMWIISFAAALSEIICVSICLLVRKKKFTYSPGGKHGADYEHNARKKSDEAEIDAILEKIKKGGYASLSEEEKKRLFDASSK